MNANYKNDMEIDLIDLCWNIVYRWKLILLAAVLGIVLAAGYKIYSNSETQKSLKQDSVATVMDKEDEIESLQNSLTELELANVDFALAYNEKLEDRMRYAEESIYNNLNASAIHCVTLTYMIENDYTFNYMEDIKPNNAAALKFAYMDYIDNGMLISDISKKLPDIDVSYLRELVPASQESDTNAIEMIRVNIYGSDTEQAQLIASEAKTAIDSYGRLVQNKIGEHKLTLVGDTVGVISDQNLKDAQNALEATLTDYRTRVVNYKKDFTDSQSRLYELLADEEGEPEDQKTEMSVEQAADVAEQAGLMDGVPKYAAIGCIGFVFLVCVVIACIYIFNGCVKTGDEFSNLFGLYLLGDYDEITEGKSKLERLRRKQKWNLNEKRELTIANLKVLCQKYGIEKIYLASTLHLEKSATEEIQHIVNVLSDNQIKAAWGENVLHDATAMEEMSTYEYVVLVEKTNLSRYDDVAQLLSTWNEQKNKALGAIVL